MKCMNNSLLTQDNFSKDKKVALIDEVLHRSRLFQDTKRLKFSKRVELIASDDE